MFRDRLEAADRLVDRLADLKTEKPLILAIPRGAVPMGRRMADALDGELDVVLVRKVGAPGNPEYAIGAVDESGRVALEPSAGHYREDAVNREVERQRALIEERRRRYTPVRAAIDPGGRVVVVVDDGSATGATMAAALGALRDRGPRRLIAALGAAPPDTVARLEGLADEVVCLEVSPHFRAVGQFFADFGQVEDEEVIALLGREAG
ncbi:Putative phosphoribosyl transferase [Halomonas sp. THAF5a]|uniref:phosphoribosyltransferase n=1 Tax=Halomonas sp. THAF5a TaxID=2587844 RepID=UPI001267C8DE|nr:phosphoribosyltransferase family protein [Halomonas sp. THAF5a]QFU02810.1 Putative phosphoribosyl transferase [Halomonas sp. THAF5a]